MIRVGFIGLGLEEWMGGVNYYKNLLFALSTYADKEVQTFVFIGTKSNPEIKKIFSQYTTIIEDSIFDRRSLKWFLQKVENNLFKTNYLLESILKRYNIQILSHTNITYFNSIKTIGWIPDFQHVHLPDMFSRKELSQRDRTFMRLIQNNDHIVLSSYDALKDFKSFAPKYENKVSVLQFVSQPEKKYFSLTIQDKLHLLHKFDLCEDFFYIPNQFWKHKNHMTVFKAVKTLVENNYNICIVCTGHLYDYRNKEYINELQNFIQENHLENNIRLLGLVDYEDVFSLIKFSKAVINPSLFEGWSSTVEECKSVGKHMILSDLDVHKEQYPEATFFKRNDPTMLYKILKDYNNPDLVVKDTSSNLTQRTMEFANQYKNIVHRVVYP